MKQSHTPDLQRRRFLQVISAGFLVSLIPASPAFASTTTPMPPGRSVYRIKGRAWVNGDPVNMDTLIKPNDTVKTSSNSELVFVVGDHAMLLRSGAHLVIEPRDSDSVGSLLIGALRLFSGKLLSVSRNKGMNIHTPTATIGIRGTGVYLEAGPDKTYFCTCYGEVDVQALNDPDSKETVVSSHHDKPLYIYGNATRGQSIQSPARLTVPNHNDDELIMAEALVSRTPPFMSKT